MADKNTLYIVSNLSEDTLCYSISSLLKKVINGNLDNTTVYTSLADVEAKEKVEKAEHKSLDTKKYKLTLEEIKE